MAPKLMKIYRLADIDDIKTGYFTVKFSPDYITRKLIFTENHRRICLGRNIFTLKVILGFPYRASFFHKAGANVTASTL